jgi:hypothetical protein
VLLDVPEREPAQDSQTEPYVGIRVRRHPRRGEDRRHAQFQPEQTRLGLPVTAPGLLQGNEIGSLPSYRFGDRALAP